MKGFTTKGGVERDGVYLAFKEEKAKEAEVEVKRWLQSIKLLNKYWL
ncbi:MAG TPA: hypothetical protein VGN63_19465 [Flavisolibacter sp.]|nr:hypothetical protein [Flavisolibacter sp.]